MTPPRPSPMPGGGLSLRRLLAAWGADRRGQFALIFALLLPGLLLTGLGAIELNQVLADERRTQDVADAAALMGAGQLSSSTSGASQRAQAYALAQLADVQAHASVSTSASTGQNAQGVPTITVGIDTQRTSFFGNLLPPGGFHTHAASTAAGVNTAPLCVLALAGSSGDQIKVAGTSQLQAGQCFLHSNGALVAASGASILGSDNEATTTASGNIVTAANVSAPRIADPFASLPVNANCDSIPAAQTLAGASAQTLAAGVHGPITLSGAFTLTLAPGEHDFCGALTVNGVASIKGTNVVLVFGKGAGIKINGTGTVSLSGLTSGALAGFVLIADRTTSGTFTIQSDYVTQMNGVVYAPTSTLQVTGTKLSGHDTPWTVIDAENILISNKAQLVINTNYNSTNVPVPNGVGDQRRGSELTQ